MSGAWKGKERLVATWFGTMRNPLSGRNNRNDDGSLRLGDILLKEGVVEVKRRNTFSFTQAEETRELAKQYKKPWVHIEFKTGTANMVRLTVDYQLAAIICAVIKSTWLHRAISGNRED